MGRLRWNATAQGWFGSTDELSVFVGEQVYKQHLNAYLLEHGIEYQSHSEYLQPAEEAWQKQCEAVRMFQADLEYWQAHQGLDVKIQLWAQDCER